MLHLTEYLFSKKLLSDPPGPPSTPIIEKITKSSVELSWSRPATDGGTKLIGYVVEMKRKGGDWSTCAHTSSVSLGAMVTGLDEGEGCQFRVRAENSAGLGEVSKPTNSVEVADQPGEFAFDR